MMLLPEVATKLEELLNSVNNPVDFSFVVKTQGYHLDSVASLKKGKNAIPVFISLIGGDYNPIPNLNEAHYNIEVVMYYPIRFKDQFYLLDNYLTSLFVGKSLNFGTQTGNALCNLSVSRYGEIIGVDLEQFAEWVEDTYEDAKIVQKTNGVTDPYMSKTFTLYLSSLGNSGVYGNDITYNLKLSLPNVVVSQITTKLVQGTTLKTYERYSAGDEDVYYAWKYSNEIIYTKELDVRYDTPMYYKRTSPIVAFLRLLTEEIVDIKREIDSHTILSNDLIWSSSGCGMGNSPASQQIIGDRYTDNTPNIINYNKSILAYYQDNDFWNAFVETFNKQDVIAMGSVQLTKTYTFKNKTYKTDLVILNINENVALGEPLSYTITFGDVK